MTGKTTLRKNGTDLPVEINFSKRTRTRAQDECAGEGESSHVFHLGRLKFRMNPLTAPAKKQRKRRR